MLVQIKTPFLCFLGDARDQLAAKTAQGVVDWRPEHCVGQLRLEGCNADLGLPDMSIQLAYEKGAKTLLIGVANSGGLLPAHWFELIKEALKAGMDVASGLHQKLKDIPEIKKLADDLGRQLFDARFPQEEFSTATGKKRSGKRVLTVGTDCSCGKMYTSLAVERALRKKGIACDFRATGQTGIFIAGSGVPIDAVIADFIAGATEALSPANDPDHIDLIEGQGSLFHPAFAGVSLGLLHGAQPSHLIMCHEPTRSHMRGLPHMPLPHLDLCIERNLEAARLTAPDVSLLGLSINTKALSENEARSYLDELSAKYNLPATDPFRFGAAALAENLLK